MKSVPLERVHTATASPAPFIGQLERLGVLPQAGDVDRGGRCRSAACTTRLPLTVPIHAITGVPSSATSTSTGDGI